MKRILALSLAMLMSAPCLLIVQSCSIFEGEGNELQYIPLTKSEEGVRDVTTDFSLRLFDHVVTADSGKNVFISPLCMSMLNAMLANGAKGDTYQEIVEAMGFVEPKMDEVNGYFSTMVSALSKADKSVDFSLANSLWISRNFSAKSSFKSRLKSVYKADLYNVDFSKKATVSQINKWCNSKTSGMIPELVGQLNDMTVMMLVDALYFKGEWQLKFKPENNEKGNFFRLDGMTSPVTFMQVKTATLKGYADEEVRIVRMPYGNGAFYMEAILPQTDDFMGFVHGLTLERLSGWAANNTEVIDLKFPKFKESYNTGMDILVAAMQAMGMKKAFTPSADFSGISDNPVWVDAALQKAAISVDEGGTEAAVAGLYKLRKANNVQKDPKEIQMYFDRPFIYLIREQSTGAILFMGAKVK